MLACMLWAMDTLIRYPLLGEGISALKIVFYEHLLLTLLFIPMLVKSYRKFSTLPSSHYFYFFIIGGVGSALATLSFTWAFTLINPSQVILLQKFQPVWAILLARPVLKEKIQGKFVFWALVCLGGGILISWSDIRSALSWVINEDLHQRKIFAGHLLTLVAVIGWGSATVFGKKLTACGHSEKEIMAGRFSMGLLCLIPYFISMEKSFSIGLPVLTKVMGMVMISGMVAMYFYYHGLRFLSARVGALAEMFFPLCAVLVNWLVLGMSLGPLQILGGVLLWLGSTVIEWNHY